MIKKILIITTLFVGLFAFSVKVSAAELNNESNSYVGVSENIPGNALNGIVLFGTSKPTNIWSWSNGAYPMSGSTSNTNLYTNYLFTGVSTLKATFTKADEAITVEVWKRNTGLFQSDSKAGTVTISRLTADNIASGQTRVASFSGLTSSANYYIKIIAPAHFSASVSY